MTPRYLKHYFLGRPLLLGLALGLGLSAMAYSQPVHPGLTVDRPAQGVYTHLAPLQQHQAPRIALYDAGPTVKQGTTARQHIDAAVMQWEWLLMGLNLPYHMVTGDALSDDLPDAVQVLILPSADALSRDAQKHLRRFIARGGGLLAAGPVGTKTDAGRPLDTSFFNTLFGATYVPHLPNASGGLLQTLQGGHPLTRGLPMGYRLNITTADSVGAARPLHSTGLGGFQRYQDAPREPELTPDLTLLLYGAHEQGRYVWLGFGPHEVSEKFDQQAVYQGLVLNALAYAARVPAVAVRPWPHGHHSATVFAGFPLVGTDYRYGLSLTHTLDVLEAGQFPATFFLTSEEARLFPGLLKRIHAHGEAALSADTDALLYGKPLADQRRRLNAGRTHLQGTGQPVVGLYPPAGLFDPNTLQAMQDAAFAYILEPQPLTSAAPTLYPPPADEDLETRYAASTAGRAPVHTGLPSNRPVAERLALPITGRDDYALLNRRDHPNPATDLLASYTADFEQQHRMRGLYLLPFHPEIQALTPERAEVLQHVAAHARKQNSWVATAGQVAAWWRQRARVEVTLAEIQSTYLKLRINNPGPTPVEGLGLDVYLPFSVSQTASETGDFDVHRMPDPNRIYLAAPVLPPGQTLVTIHFETAPR